MQAEALGDDRVQPLKDLEVLDRLMSVRKLFLPTILSVQNSMCLFALRHFTAYCRRAIIETVTMVEGEGVRGFARAPRLFAFTKNTLIIFTNTLTTRL